VLHWSSSIARRAKAAIAIAYSMKIGVFGMGSSVARQSASLRSVNACRCMLVFTLIVFQSLEVSESYDRIAGTPLWVVPGWTVAALFALAGFTSVRSMERNSPATAAARFAGRFLPAIILLIVITAYGLGTAITVESKRYYLLSPDVAAYLLNILGIPRYALPGVFQYSPATGMVNAVLWVLPPTYLAAIMLGAGAWRMRRLTQFLVTGGSLLAILAVGLLLAGVDLGDADGLLVLLVAGKGLNALLSFFAGALIYRLRQHVPVDWRLVAAVCMLMLPIALAGNQFWLDNAFVSSITAVPIAYLAIYACSLPWPLRHWARHAEPLLWRTLLLGYPVQQVVMALGPSRQSGIVNLAVALPIIVALACGMWFLVERPMLRRFMPRILAPTVHAAPARRSSAGDYVDRARATLPLIVGAMFVVLLVLAALALTMFAMQRDAGGA
jgi:hypothetical protein